MRTLLTPFFALLLSGYAFLSSGHAFAHLKVSCDDPSNLQNVAHYKETLGEFAKQNGTQSGGTIECTSCFRTVEKQAELHNACEAKRGKGNCGGWVAKPGQSQHNKKQIAVCDLKGIKGSTQSACQALANLCKEKFGGNCGIGGYGSGSYHFGTNDDHFSSWNQCGFLGNAAGQATQLYDNYKSANAQFFQVVGQGLGDLFLHDD